MRRKSGQNMFKTVEAKSQRKKTASLDSWRELSSAAMPLSPSLTWLSCMLGVLLFFPLQKWAIILHLKKKTPALIFSACKVYGVMNLRYGHIIRLKISYRCHQNLENALKYSRGWGDNSKKKIGWIYKPFSLFNQRHNSLRWYVIGGFLDYKIIQQTVGILENV